MEYEVAKLCNFVGSRVRISEQCGVRIIDSYIIDEIR